MSEQFPIEPASGHEDTTENPNANELPAEIQQRREFLQSLGKWSGAAIVAAVAGGAWLASAGKASAGAWVNRRLGGGGWINRRVGGGAWVNGGGAWVNRRVGGGSWINRR